MEAYLDLALNAEYHLGMVVGLVLYAVGLLAVLGQREEMGGRGSILKSGELGGKYYLAGSEPKVICAKLAGDEAQVAVHLES